MHFIAFETVRNILMIIFICQFIFFWCSIVAIIFLFKQYFNSHSLFFACYFRNLRRVVGKRWPPAALTWSSTPVPCPRRPTSSSSSSRCPRKWFQQRCNSPCPASSCERAKPRKSSSLHLQNQLTTPTLKDFCHFKLRSHFCLFLFASVT